MITCAALFTACKKDKVEETPVEPVVPIVPPKTVAQKITAKWGITTIADNDYYSNTSHMTTYTGVASDYLDFRSDNKLYIQTVPYGRDTLSYNLVNDSTMNLEGDLFKIQTISDTKFVMFYKETYSTTPLEYYTSTITLAK